MAINDMSTVAYIYKRRYSDKAVTELAMREHPTFYEINKQGDFTGDGLFYGITYGNPQGIAGTFAAAKTASETLKGVQLRVDPVLKYGFIEIDGPALLRARGNKGAMYDLVTRVSDGILEELGSDLAFDLQRDGSGVRGRRESAAGNVITLTSRRHVDRFKVGMTLSAALNADGTTPRTGTCKVVKVNRASRTVEVDNIAGITGFVNNDYLFRNGTAGACMQGFAASTPLTAPGGADSYRGINRSVDIELLAGSRFNDLTMLPEDSCGELAVEISTIAKKVTRGAMYPTDFHQVVKRLGAKVEYTNPGGNADIGFESFLLHTSAGVVKMYSDPDTEPGQARLFRPETHLIKHCEELVHIIRDDGNAPAMRATGTDGIEIRARNYSNYVQFDTAPHGVCTFAT